MTFLLDADVLIALTVDEHEHHQRSAAWVATVDRVAVCPVVEGALVRFLLRLGEPVVTAVEVIRRIRALPSCDFWTDSISYADVDLSQVVGHRQVTDAYLVSLARSNQGKLATLDRGVTRLFPDQTLLLPSVDPPATT